MLDIKLTKYDNEIDSLTKVMDVYPSSISDPDIHDEYTLVFNEIKTINELRNDLVYDYNNMNNSTIIDEYNKLIKSLNKLIESFNQAQQEKSPNTRTILDIES